MSCLDSDFSSRLCLLLGLGTNHRAKEIHSQRVRDIKPIDFKILHLLPELIQILTFNQMDCVLASSPPPGYSLPVWTLR